MPVVGSAEVIVTAITTGFEKSLKDAFGKGRKIAADEGRKYGDEFGSKFAAKFDEHLSKAFLRSRDRMAAEGDRQGGLFADAFATRLQGISTSIDVTIDEDGIRERVANAIREGNESAAGAPGAGAGTGAGATSSDASAQEKAFRLSSQKLAQLQGQALAEEKKRQEQLANIARKNAQDQIDLIASLQGQALAEEKKRQEQLANIARKNAQEIHDLIASLQGQALAEDKKRQADAAAAATKAAEKIADAQRKAAAKLEADLANLQGQALAERQRREQQAIDEINNLHGRALEEDKRRTQKAMDDLARMQGQALAEDKRRTKAAADQAEAEAKRRKATGGFNVSSSFLAEAKAASEAFRMLVAKGNILGPGITSLIGGVASLGAGFVSLAASATQAAGALVVIPSLFSALGQAGITAAFAFSGVGKAISAGFSAAAAGTDGAGKTAAATNALADAQKALGRAYEDNAKRIRNANRRVEDAEEDLIERQNEARLAQEALTSARERAEEQLEDLAFSVESAGLAEERAILNMEDATKRLAEVRANPASTLRDLQEASLAYREAELAVRMAQDALEDLQEEQEKATEAGIEGSPEVIEAKNDIAEANNRVADAAERLAEAEEDRNDVMIQNARALEDAQLRVARAMETSAGGVDAYAQALAELSPEAQEFVKFIVTLKDDIDDLQAAAGQELFPNLTTSVKEISEKFFPVLREALITTGAALGDFSRSIADTITGGGFLTRFGVIAEDNARTIQRFGTIFASVIDGISGILFAAGPIVERFTSFLADKAWEFQGFATGAAGIEKMAQFFEHAGDTAAKFGEIIGNLISAFGGLMSAADESGQTMLDRLIEISQNFEDFVRSAEGHTELQDYFNDAGENASEVLGLIWDIIKALATLGASPGVGEAARTLRAEWVPVLEEILETMAGASGALADLVVEVTNIIDVFADTGSIQLFLGILSSVAATVFDIIDSDIGQFFISIFGPVAAAASAFNLVFKAAQSVVLIMSGIIFNVTGFVAGIGAFVSGIGSVVAAAWTGLALLASEMTIAAGAAIVASGATTTFGAAMAGLAGAARVLGGALLTLIANPAVALVAALTAGIAIFTSWSNAQKEAKRRTEEFSDTLNQQTGAVTAATLEKYINELDSDLIPALQAAGLGVDEMMTALAGSDADWQAFVSRALEANINLANFADGTKGFADLQEDFRDQIGESQAALAVSNDIQKVSNELVKESSAALADQKVAAMSVEEQNKFVTEGLKKLNEQYEGLIDNYTNLNDSAVTSERTAIRIAEANDELGASFDEILEGLARQIDANGKVTKSQEALTKVGEDGREQIDQSVKSGRDLQTQIIDYLSLLDEQMQANIDNGMSVEDATKKYNDQKQAFIDSAGAAGISTQAVANYIAQIELTPSEKKTRFIAVMEEAAVTKMISEIDDLGLQARVIEMVGQLDHDPTLADIIAIKAQLEAELPGLQFPITISEQTLATTRSTLDSMLVDDDGNPLTAPILLAEHAASFKAVREQLVAFSRTLGVPIKPEVMDPEVKAAKKIMDDLLVDEHGDPRTVEMLTEVEKKAYEAAEKEFNTLSRERAALMTPQTRASEITRVQAELDALMAPRTTPLSVDDKNAIATKKAELNALQNPLTTPLTVAVKMATNTVSGGIPPHLWAQWYPGVPYPGKAEGGPIEGPGGPTADKVGPFMLSSGEFVLSAKAVQAMGGTSAVTAMHRALKRGGAFRPPNMQAGGTVQPQTGGTLVRLAEAGAAERVTPLDRNGLSAGDRAILAELKRLRAGGMNVAIGTIEVPDPPAAAKEVVLAMRSEAYRMGQFR